VHLHFFAGLEFVFFAFAAFTKRPALNLLQHEILIGFYSSVELVSIGGASICEYMLGWREVIANFVLECRLEAQYLTRMKSLDRNTSMLIYIID
jgi:hypothetical protein